MTKRILSIDPGVKHAGVAYWMEHSGLYYLELAYLATLAGTPTLARSVSEMPQACELGHVQYITHVVVELPQVYSRDKSKGDPNDLIKVAAVAGAISKGVFAEARSFVLPAEWKGAAPKDVTEARCRSYLMDSELVKIDLPKAKSLQHNVWDAIGIGLWYLKKNKLRSTRGDV